MIKFVSLSRFLRFYHFYGLFTAYLLHEEVMLVRLYDKHFESGDMFLICHMISRDHICKSLCDFIGGR